jgi:hypothetical protein
VDAIPHNLVRFESQLERAISRERGRRWHRSAGRGRSITWLAFTLLALVVGVGLVLFWHDRAGATGTLEREAPPYGKRPDALHGSQARYSTNPNIPQPRRQASGWS